MLYALLLMAVLLCASVWHVRRHFSALVPAYRVDETHGQLTVRRYPRIAVAEVRVTGSASLALRTATALLDRYFREERIARFALPLMAEKVDSADPIWAMSAVLPMELESAPAPRNKSIQVLHDVLDALAVALNPLFTHTHCPVVRNARRTM